MGNNDSNGRYLARVAEAGLKLHPARFPVQLPEWFIKLLTDPGDLVVDLFGGSMTTGWAAERTGRNWIGMDLVPEYVSASRLRFFDEGGSLLPDEHSAKASLVPVIDLARNKDVTSNESEIPASLEVRPAS